MLMNFEDKLRAKDFDVCKLDEWREAVKYKIINDEDFMKEVKQSVREEFPELEGTDVKKFNAYVDLKVDEVATATVDKIKVYVDVDLEVVII